MSHRFQNCTSKLLLFKKGISRYLQELSLTDTKKSVILPSKVSTILKNAREKEDFPLPVRPQIPICDTERR